MHVSCVRNHVLSIATSVVWHRCQLTSLKPENVSMLYQSKQFLVIPWAFSRLPVLEWCHFPHSDLLVYVPSSLLWLTTVVDVGCSVFPVPNHSYSSRLGMLTARRWYDIFVFAPVHPSVRYVCPSTVVQIVKIFHQCGGGLF